MSLNKKYYIMLGRRQPLHFGHLNQILDVINRGGFVLIFIGSVNDVTNRFYNPLQNPLNLEESITQLNVVLKEREISDYKIIPIKDFGDDDLWINFITNTVKENFPNLLMSDVFFHFFAKSSKEDETFKTLDKYVSMFEEKGIYSVIFQGSNRSNHLNSSYFRKIGIDNEDFLNLPAANYLLSLILAARISNKEIFGNLIDDKLPLTMLDLSLQRLVKECEIKKKQLSLVTNINEFEEVLRKIILDRK